MTYDFYIGWQDYRAGLPFDPAESDSWKAGWTAARNGNPCGESC